MVRSLLIWSFCDLGIKQVGYIITI